MEVVKELRRCFVILVVLSSIISGHDIRKPPAGSGIALSRKLVASFKKGVGADCVDTITCGSERFVRKCTNCDPRYFYCASPGAAPLEKQCPSGQLFNPDPYYPKCILSGNCPFHPYPVPSTTKKPDPTALTTKGSCVDTVVCKEKSFIAKCSYCDPRYFFCSGAGAEPVPKTCPSGQMFNPDPYYPKCILTNNCPYHPPWVSTTTTTTSTTTTTATTTTTVPSTTTTTSTVTTTVPSTTTPSTTPEPTTSTTSTTTEPSTTSPSTTPEPTTSTTSTTTEPSTTSPSTTPEPSTTAAPTTLEPSTTAASTTPEPSTTAVPTTPEPSTTAASTTPEPSTTAASTTPEPSTTAASTTPEPSTTAASTTSEPSTTAASTTAVPTTTATSTIATASTTSIESTSASAVTDTPTSSGTTAKSPCMVISDESTTSPECRDTLICEGPGDFWRCNACFKEYFYCEKEGDVGTCKECENGLVFNPDPEFPKCILPSSCPVHPEPTGLWSIF